MTFARWTLLTGAVLAAAAAFGPVWVVRAGVVLAVVGGVVALVHALRALRDQRQESGERALAQSRAHGAALHAERRHHSEVLQVLSDRLTRTQASLVEATADAMTQRTEVSQLRQRLRTADGTATSLRTELADAQRRIAVAEERVAEQEAELFVLRAEVEAHLAEQRDAEVLGIPRRGRDDDPELHASAG